MQLEQFINDSELTMLTDLEGDLIEGGSAGSFVKAVWGFFSSALADLGQGAMDGGRDAQSA